MVAMTLGKKLELPMQKRSDDSVSRKTCTLSMTCHIDVVNKQLVPPLS